MVTSPTPVLPLSKAEYLRRGVGEVRGWLIPSTAVYLSSLEVLQRADGPAGDVCEIGIHHGRSFLCLALGLPDGDRAVAIDVFDDVEANVDNSGKGDRTIFEQNLKEHGAGDNVEIIQASSLDLERRNFVGEGRGSASFGRLGTRPRSPNDLSLAERTVIDGGLVVLDDVLSGTGSASSAASSTGPKADPGPACSAENCSSPQRAAALFRALMGHLQGRA
jgi:predicted O-methyltransferase YrrM